MATGAQDPRANGDEARTAGEVERLRAERDELAARLARSEDKAGRRRRYRSLAVGTMVVLACLLVTVTVPAIWAYRTVLRTDPFVERVTPIGFDPAVTPVLSDRLTTQVFGVLDVEAVVADALPPRAQILAGPLTGAVRDFVQERVQQVLDSDQFRELWIRANRFAHEQVMAVLRDESEVVQTQDGRVVLNLVPVVNEVLQRIEAEASGMFQRDVSLPEIGSGEVPEEARERISAALGVELPEDFGEITVFEADSLTAAQDAVKVADRGVWVLAVLSILFFAGALFLSNRRRRTLLQLTIGTLIGLVVVRRAGRWLEEELVDLARTPEGGRALNAITDQVMGSFFSVTATLIVIGLIVILIAAITGPYSWAVKTRARTVTLYRSAVQAAGTTARQESTVAWVGEHREVLQLGGAAAIVLILLLFDMSWPLFLLLLAMLGVYELALTRIGAPPGSRT
jgi:hypothetical protein